MFNHIRADLNRFAPPHLAFKARLALAVRHVGFHALAVYRFGRWLQVHSQRPYHWGWLWLLWLGYGIGAVWVRAGFGIHLALSAHIGPGLLIGHIGGIHLQHCRLGQGCNIGQQVKVGPWAGQQQGPQLGDRVWVGAHAQITGPIHLGSGVTVAAGTQLNACVPAQHLIGGNPARILRTQFNNRVFLGDGLLPEEPPSISEHEHKILA